MTEKTTNRYSAVPERNAGKFWDVYDSVTDTYAPFIEEQSARQAAVELNNGEMGHDDIYWND